MLLAFGGLKREVVRDAWVANGAVPKAMGAEEELGVEGVANEPSVLLLNPPVLPMNTGC